MFYELIIKKIQGTKFGNGSFLKGISIKVARGNGNDLYVSTPYTQTAHWKNSVAQSLVSEILSCVLIKQWTFIHSIFTFILEKII